MSDPLPPLNALRVFKVIAESGGIRVASQILNITQSAVSRHLAVLEDHLQLVLFHRRGRGLELTDAGKDYLLQVAPALEAIGAATTATRRRTHRQTLVLSAPPSLIANWLMPRLPGFLAAFPEIDLRLVDALVLDPADTDVACAIEYRFQPAPGSAATPLLSDEVVPVVSPAHHDLGRLTGPDSLRGITLIETARRLLSWQGLLHDRPWLAQQPFLTVSYSLHALQAARLGLGVALANRHNARALIAAGELAIPFRFGEDVAAIAPSYFVTLPPRHVSEPARALRDWLLREAGSDT